MIFRALGEPARSSMAADRARPAAGAPLVTAPLRASDLAVACPIARVPSICILPQLHLAVPLLGKYLTYAMLALALDLVWGYCGILSLGHGAFFALGGYAMGMYLMRQIGARGVYGNPILPDFMVFLNYKALPWFWYGFDNFWFAVHHGGAGAGPARLRLRLVRLPQPRHRRLPVDHHPGDDLRAAARLLPQRYGLWRQ